MILLFCFAYFFNVVTCEPRKPYWNDFKASFFFNALVFGKTWKAAGDIYYKVNEKDSMRVDYWNYCEPHFNWTNYWHSCSYVFTRGYVFYVSEKDCCVVFKMTPISPDFFNDSTYMGVEMLNGKVANRWNHNQVNFDYWADYGDYSPIKHNGPQWKLGIAHIDWVMVDSSSEIDDSLFDIPSSCEVSCPYPPQPPPKSDSLYQSLFLFPFVK